jgi:hypothetical protein
MNEDEKPENTTASEGTETEKSLKIEVQDDSAAVDLEKEQPLEEIQSDEVDSEINPETTVEEAIEASEDDSVYTDLKTDTDIDEAIDDIVRSESDDYLKEADAKLAAATVVKKPGLKSKVKALASAWWKSKKARYATFAILGLLFVLSTLIPASRYAILNVFGVRVKTSMTVIDSQTRLPLKNIYVNIQGKEQFTDEEGYVSFEKLKLGASNLEIKKRGFADSSRKIILGWGSNPIGEQEIIATGEQFTFVLSDWISGDAVVDGAEATAGENSAKADDTGKITLTIGEESIRDVEVTVTAEGYRDESFSSDELVDSEIPVRVVPRKHNLFVSNRDGRFDIYKIDLDTKNEEVLLAATEKEREVPAILSHPSRNIAAIVSSRDGVQNSDGFTLDGLFIVDSETEEFVKVSRSEQIQLFGWYENKLMYSQVVEGTSRGNPERSKLFSYDYDSGDRIELASANYFNDVELVGSTLTFAVSSFAVPQSQAKLYQVDTAADEPEVERILDKQVYNIFRSGYDTLLFSAVEQAWYKMVGDNTAEETDPVPTPSSKKFIDSPNGEMTAWVEVRDGKGVLLVSVVEDFKEEKILELPGLDRVKFWAHDNTLVFQVITSSETADYVVNLSKPEDVRKIVDVTASARLYY